MFAGLQFEIGRLSSRRTYPEHTKAACAAQWDGDTIHHFDRALIKRIAYNEWNDVLERKRPVESRVVVVNRQADQQYKSTQARQPMAHGSRLMIVGPARTVAADQ